MQEPQVLSQPGPQCTILFHCIMIDILSVANCISA